MSHEAYINLRDPETVSETVAYEERFSTPLTDIDLARLQCFPHASLQKGRYLAPEVYKNNNGLLGSV